MDTVAKNLESIRSQIGESVTIVGITKYQPIEKVRQAVEAGLTHLGINYAQAGEELQTEFASKPLHWHFVGHIQSRKVKYLTSYEWVESLERLEIASKLNERLKEGDKKVSLLIEINIGDETSKSGTQAEKVGDFLKELKPLSQLQVRGFMCMPPPLEPIEDRRPFFQQTKQLFDQYQTEYGLDTLSMGTSEDYPIAVEEGATIIRLGSCLFGSR